jgi:hypothetical protein
MAFEGLRSGPRISMRSRLAARTNVKELYPALPFRNFAAYGAYS